MKSLVSLSLFWGEEYDEPTNVDKAYLSRMR